jgi:hypothetical protein
MAAYTINLTSGTTLIPGGLQPNTYDTTHSSITLIGQNYSGYGQFINDNFVHILENFSNTSSPPNPLPGQLWWDSQNKILNVYTGTSWKISTGATSLPSATTSGPADLSKLGGDLWYDSTNQQLRVYSGTQWITVGPVASAGPTGNSGAQPALINDLGSGNKRIVLELVVNNTVYALIASANFTTDAPGFSTIVPGLNFASGYGLGLNTQDQNPTPLTLAQRDQYGGLNATALVLSGTNPTITGAASIATASTGSVTAGVLNGNLSATTAIVTTSIVPSANNQATVGSSTKYFANVYSQNVSAGTVQVSNSILPYGNLIANIGSVNNWFNEIYGTAIHAQYADLAERFEADAEYEPGTVVEIGGTKEITQVDKDLSESVFGVISTSAAYLMNSRAGTNLTHPPIAMQGRVPVKVIGIINKGDRLVSAGNGRARAGKRSELTSLNVIGRALETKTTAGDGIIEAVVKLNS